MVGGEPVGEVMLLRRCSGGVSRASRRSSFVRGPHANDDMESGFDLI